MAPTPAVEDVKKLVPLEKVKTYDRSLQVRGGIDPKKVERYRQIMRDNGADGVAGYMDAIMVFRESADDVHYIADGFHRIESADQEGSLKIPVIFRHGGRSKALRHALGENGHHGAQMTNAEKRHAADMAVLDPELGKLTDQNIAKLIGCSPSLVGDCRRGETPAAKAAKREEKKQTPVDPPSESPRETESPAPKSATARERKPVDNRPTKAMILKQISEYVNLDMVDEADVIALFDTEQQAYYFMGRPGTVVPLKVVGKSGRVQCEVETVVKSITTEGVVLRYEGFGKVSLEIKGSSVKVPLLLLFATWNHPLVRDWQVCLSGMHGQQVHPYCINEFTLDEAIKYIKTVAPYQKNVVRDSPVGLPGEQPYYYISYEPDKTCGRCHKGLK